MSSVFSSKRTLLVRGDGLGELEGLEDGVILILIFFFKYLLARFIILFLGGDGLDSLEESIPILFFMNLIARLVMLFLGLGGDGNGISGGRKADFNVLLIIYNINYNFS